MYLTKYRINSYKTRDHGWGASFTPPIQQIGPSELHVSGRFEFGKYFSTKEEADNFTKKYLISKGLSEEFIQIEE